MKCPNCKDTNLVITERKDIEIDYCPECRGVWLDRGELDKIIDKSSSFETRPYKDDRDSDRYYQKPYKSKTKSFLSELFD